MEIVVHIVIRMQRILFREHDGKMICLLVNVVREWLIGGGDYGLLLADKGLMEILNERNVSAKCHLMSSDRGIVNLLVKWVLNNDVLRLAEIINCPAV